jgi:hypothetical protein
MRAIAASFEVFVVTALGLEKGGICPLPESYDIPQQAATK